MAALLCLAASAALAQASPSSPSSAQSVVVTAARAPQAAADVLADVSVLDRNAIERSGAINLGDLLVRLPGMELARNGGSGSTTSVFVRGSETRHVAVYIDGLRVDGQSTGGAPWELLPLDLVERVEVLRGPAAAIYGSDAIAGVVQLFTRREAGKTSASAALTAGSEGLLRGRAALSGKAGALDGALSVMAEQADGLDARPSRNPDRDGWRRQGVQAGVGLDLAPGQRLDAQWLSGRLRAQYDGTAGVDDVSRHSLQVAGAGWSGRWADGSVTRAQLGETRNTYETQPSYYRTETQQRHWLLQHDLALGANQQLGALLERREDELLNPSTQYSPTLAGQRHQDALALSWRARWGSQQWQAHWRHDRDSEFGKKPTASLAWGWGFAPTWRVGLSAASAFRAPTLFQRFSDYGNASLKSETSRNVEASLRWQAGASEASLVVFRNRVGNLIDWTGSGDCKSRLDDPTWGGCYNNVGRARLQGVTLAGLTRLAGVALSASLDYHDPRNLDTDRLLARRARVTGTLAADTTLAGWELGLDWRASGQRYDIDNKTLAGYGLLGLRAEHALMAGLRIEVRVDNLTDQRYETARTYASSGRTGQVGLRWTL
ncbi:TonB-dependent receptor domain-containing protein [Aquabacterium sp. OR-4]|uniref:TonB-dependent receptor domain-containing protein n=1 Tax=Aquabacterium sp. OR-4 TaxID=2978127 RepID=UPI0021B45CC1|nr:TonB-dependent receptor [Aquabacterium sp. OR-4]MDT7836133.1 TonB-dependent receptor [Aquabacterium sp. OR-4]